MSGRARRSRPRRLPPVGLATPLADQHCAGPDLRAASASDPCRPRGSERASPVPSPGPGRNRNSAPGRRSARAAPHEVAERSLWRRAEAPPPNFPELFEAQSREPFDLQSQFPLLVIMKGSGDHQRASPSASRVAPLDLHLLRDDGQPLLLLKRPGDGAPYRKRLPARRSRQLCDRRSGRASQQGNHRPQLALRYSGVLMVRARRRAVLLLTLHGDRVLRLVLFLSPDRLQPSGADPQRIGLVLRIAAPDRHVLAGIAAPGSIQAGSACRPPSGRRRPSAFRGTTTAWSSRWEAVDRMTSWVSVSFMMDLLQIDGSFPLPRPEPRGDRSALAGRRSEDSKGNEAVRSPSRFGAGARPPPVGGSPRGAETSMWRAISKAVSAFPFSAREAAVAASRSAPRFCSPSLASVRPRR